MSCSDNFIVPAANPCLGVKEVIAGTNVTITGSIYTPTINATGGGGGGGVTSLAYTTGINGSATFGAVTLSNTGVTSIINGTGISIAATGSGGTGAVTINNTGLTSLNGGSNISISGSNTINLQTSPTLTTPFLSNLGATNNQFVNSLYPHTSGEYYQYLTGGGGNTDGVLGVKQIWCVDDVSSYYYNNFRMNSAGLSMQQAASGTSYPFVTWDGTYAHFNLSNVNAPIFKNSMGFNSFGTDCAFSNVVYPYGSPEYYPYMYNGTGSIVNNTLGAKQFWATNGPGNTSYNVMQYRYDSINAQQTMSGSTIPFMTYNDATGTFALSNTTNVVNSIVAGTGITISATGSGGTGDVTINSSASGGVTSIIAGVGVSISATGSGGTGDVTINNTTTGSIYGTAVLTRDTIIYNPTDYVYWTTIADNVNTYLYSDPKIVYPTQSGIYHLTWNLNVVASFISGSNFIITTKPGCFDLFGTTFTGKNGGTVSYLDSNNSGADGITNVSGQTQISFDRSIERGFAIQYTVNVYSPGIPSPPIPLVAFANSGSLNYTQCTLTIHKLGDLPAPSFEI